MRSRLFSSKSERTLTIEDVRPTRVGQEYARQEGAHSWPDMKTLKRLHRAQHESHKHNREQKIGVD